MLTKEEIKKIIPHREPMLLIDSVRELEIGERITAFFFIRNDWDIFQGHFPDEPVLPGVLAVECMAQASDILLMSQAEYAGKKPYFIGIDEVKFKAKIKPGDEIEIRSAVFRKNAEKKIITCAAEIRNNGVLAAEGKVTLAMR